MPEVDPVRTSLLRQAARAYLRASRLLDPVRLRAWEEQGITFPQLRILFRVRANPGVDLGGLAGSIGITLSAASQQVDKLVGRGLVAREESPEDRRRLRLALTASGEAALGEYSRAAVEHSTAIVDALTDQDLQDLIRLLGALVEARNAPVPAPAAVTR